MQLQVLHAPGQTPLHVHACQLQGSVALAAVCFSSFSAAVAAVVDVSGWYVSVLQHCCCFCSPADGQVGLIPWATHLWGMTLFVHSATGVATQSSCSTLYECVGGQPVGRSLAATWVGVVERNIAALCGCVVDAAVRFLNVPCGGVVGVMHARGKFQPQHVAYFLLLVP